MPDEGKPEGKKKDVWDKLSSLTPLLIGLAVTGVGTYFTNIYNYRQLQLNQVEALDKLRPLLNSEKPEDRAFAYSSFSALGYKDLAVRMINSKNDDAGRVVLEQIEKTADPGTRQEASMALGDLDRARKLVEQREHISEVNGKTVAATGDGTVSGGKLPPGFNLPSMEYYQTAQKWAVGYRDKLGGSQLLSVSILMDTYAHLGQGGAEQIGAAASLRVKPPLNKEGSEAAWDGAFLDEAEKSYQGKIANRADQEKLIKLWEQRVAPFRKHLAAGDLALKNSSLDK